MIKSSFIWLLVLSFCTAFFVGTKVTADPKLSYECNYCLYNWRFNYDTVCGLERPVKKFGKVLSSGGKITVKDIKDGDLTSCAVMFLNIGALCHARCGEFRLSPEKGWDTNINYEPVDEESNEFLRSLTEFGKRVDSLQESVEGLEAHTIDTHNKRKQGFEEVEPMVENAVQRAEQLQREMARYRAIQSARRQLLQFMAKEFSGSNNINVPELPDSNDTNAPEISHENIPRPETQLEPDVILDNKGPLLILH